MRPGRLLFTTLATAVLCTSCSAILELEKKQCEKAEECGSFEGKPTYSCEDNFCRRIPCTTDATCASRGNFVCETGGCEEALCTAAAECAANETCAGGRCVDPIFHCFDDKVPLSSSEEPVLRVNVVAYGDNQPLKKLDVKVCNIMDVPCNAPIAATSTYAANGDLEIRGLENGRRYSIRMLGTGAGDVPYAETEYYMQRPVIGLTQEADRFELVPEALIGAVGDSAGEAYNPKLGLVIAEIFGCDNKPLAGVSIDDNRSGTLFYLTGVANTNATETNGTGQGGFINMETTATGAPLQHQLSFRWKGQNLFSMGVVPRPGVLTFMNLYMPDYGSTDNRAATVER